MADIRIKDLATTASSAASDDFMALDGATNGTRKMSAANPSVTTLTTSGVIAPGGSVHGANGTAANPSFAFLSNQNTGLYRIGANNIGVAANGAKVLDIATTGLGVTGAVTATTTLADQGGTIAAQRNALAPSQALSFTGTGGATFTTAAFGTGDFTVSAKANLTSLSASVTAAIFGGAGNGFALTVFNSAGTLFIYPRIVYGSAITSVAALPGFSTNAVVTYTRTGTTGKIYVNGILADTVTDANNYTGAVAAIGSNAVAAEWFWTGTITPIVVENRALSAAEVLALYQTGTVPASDINNASNTAKYTSDFSAGTNGWAEFAGGQSVLTAPITGAGVANTLRITKGSTGLVQLLTGQLSQFKQYRVTFDYYLDVSSGITSFHLGGSGSAESNLVTPVEGSWQTGVALSTTQPLNNVFFIAEGLLASGKNIYIKNFTVYATGALVLPESNALGSGTTWRDVSGNAANITWTTGVNWLLPWSGTITGPVTITGATNATLNLGTSQLNSTGGNLTLFSATDQNVALSATGAGNTYIGNSGTGSTNTGKLVVNGTSVIKGVRTATASINFGTVGANTASSVFDVTITGVVSDNSHSINVTWDNSDWAPTYGVVNAIAGTDKVSLRIYNPTASSVVIGTRTIRVTVTSF